MSDLSLGVLRQANLARLPEFKNAKGELAHSEADGSDWLVNDWVVAVVGELGEFANVAKKVRRGDLTLDEARWSMAEELADIQIYQSFPGEWTARTGDGSEIKDTPRYRMIGNAVTVPVARWIGRRLAVAIQEATA